MDKEKVELKWATFKHVLVGRFADCSPDGVMTCVLSNDSLGSICPMLSQLTAIVLALPVTTAVCERGFSTMNRIKTDSRNHINTTTLERLIRLSSEGPSIKNFCFSKAVDDWAKRSSRRIKL